jgi:hypothetical protein
VLDSSKAATAADMADDESPSHFAQAVCNLTYEAKPSSRLIQKDYQLDASADMTEFQTLQDANDYFKSIEGYSIEELRQMARDPSDLPATVDSVDDVTAIFAKFNGITVEQGKQKQLMPTRLEIHFEKSSAVLNCLVTKRLDFQVNDQSKISDLSASDLLLQLMSKYGKLTPGIDNF